jgi:hypothetical protein
VKLKVSTLISAFCPGWTKPISRLESMASISSWFAWNDHGERLSRRHHASQRMDGEPLHGAIDRRSQMLEFGAPLGFDHLLGSARGLRLGFRECIIGCTLILRGGLVPRLLQQGDGRIGFAQPALVSRSVG